MHTPVAGIPMRFIVAATLVLLLTVPGAAAAASAREAFEKGVEAAQEEQYRQAVEHFEAARRAGLDTGALHFNLGVALYRLGRLDEAEAAFSRAVDSGSMVAPAHYQLGRIARERGDGAGARKAFRRAARTAKTASLRRRARAALAALDGAPSAPDYVYLGVGGGHDSNIALTPSDASGASERSDQFVDATLVGRWPLEDRFYLRGSAYLQEFFDEDEFSLIALRGGVGRVGRFDGGWEWNAWIDARHQRLGGDAFDNALLAGGRLQRPLNTDWRFRFDYELELARGASDFGYLDGAEHDFEASLDERGRSGWTLSAGVATADRDDLATANDFFSFSYDEFSLGADHTFRLDADHHLTLSGDWRRRDYDGQEVRDGTARGTREEDRYGLTVALDRRLGQDWSARADLRVERRDSTINDFDYEREMIRVRLERVF